VTVRQHHNQVDFKLNLECAIRHSWGSEEARENHKYGDFESPQDIAISDLDVLDFGG
jgi:hypothetical protein